MCQLASSASGVNLSTCSATCAPLASSFGCDGNGGVTTFPDGVGACTSQTACNCYRCDKTSYTCSSAPMNVSQTTPDLYASLSACSAACVRPIQVFSFAAGASGQATIISGLESALQFLNFNLTFNATKTTLSTSVTCNVSVKNASSLSIRPMYTVQLRNLTRNAGVNFINFSPSSTLAGNGVMSFSFSVMGATYSTFNFLNGDSVVLIIFTNTTSAVLTSATFANAFTLTLS
jgi:hypothetical protein